VKSRSFAHVFDPRLNALNLVRLLLATGVIVWHSFSLGGYEIVAWPVLQFMADFFVDGFFAVSGFLIVASWTRDPHWGRFLKARVLRIMPAFWVCLVVTAFIIAPLAQRVWGPENITYVLKNSALWMFQYDIAGTPLGVPFSGTWDGSLWTLRWEFGCYLGVLALGVCGLLKRSWVIPTLFGLATMGAIANAFGFLGGVLGGNVPALSRFGLMFLAGAMIYQFRDRVRVSPLWAAVAVVIVAGSLFMPNYRIFAALPVAYVVLVAGAVIKRERLRLRNDISYGVYIYAFPMQQVLVILGVSAWGVPWFVILSALVTLPLALASWFLIEKPAMRLRRRAPALPAASVAAAA
jgi:peptidoglycan/LPS O-acetylase OafA/YrhL